ncbi:MAG: phosphate acyltransferase PlsX [Alphaproteobacteria bacterium]|nr:MAG: phosphate acyltransferase PlsX [Alphaproteobacteria bacterium]
MGGDHGPATVIAGAEIARGRLPHIRYLLYGREADIAPHLDAHPKLRAAAQVVAVEQVVLGTDKPSQALRRGRESSMGQAIQAVKDGAADVAVSAGNTGALMAMARFILRTMPGIDRPALVSLLPTVRGESVMLDLGANVDSTADNLVQFAVMGAVFARTVLGLERPRVGLLNIGSEELKGTGEIKAAGRVLKATALPMEFAGFTEGDRIGAGDMDVVVCDGFIGNVALKTTEGTARLIAELLERAFRSSFWSKLGYGLARPALTSLRDHLDPNNHNGAVMLGLNGLVVKSHGGANAQGIATAINTAVDLAGDNILARIADDMKHYQSQAETAAAADI